jgi:signal transduction histidine kinase
MGGFGMRRSLVIILMAVVIAPAVVLSLLAIRAISHEEAYVEKQLAGTLSAEVTHASSVIATEVEGIRAELAETAVIPAGDDPAREFREWKNRSPLVEVPFLLSPEHEILWPRLAADSDRPEVETKAITKTESAFLEGQQAFLSDEEETPVYENIAVAYKDDILGGTKGRGTPEAKPPRPSGAGTELRAGTLSEGGKEDVAGEETEAVPEAGGLREYSRAQSAVTEFQRHEEVREKVYDRAEMEGQEVGYRNVRLGAQGAPAEPGAREARFESESESQSDAYKKRKSPEAAQAQPESGATAALDKGSPRETVAGAAEGDRRREEAGRIRSIFISQPLRFSEIVADKQSGLIPRMMDGELKHLFWERLQNGNILGCLVDPDELRDRLVGSLPSIYSPARILTVLDESGRPLIVPQGLEDRDWSKPFVAEEVSSLLPRWEAAAYLSDPDEISSRARATTLVMWILILILFVSILTGGVIMLRSAYADLRLAQQKTSFVASVSHELKTPLTSIRMFAEMLRDGRQTDAGKQKQYLDIMTAEAERLTRLINNVLDFSRMERGEKRYDMKRCDLVGLTSEVVENQRARLENNGFTVVFTTRSGEIPVVADEEAIKQAIVNLLSNAEKYSPDIREIEVQVGRENGLAAVAVSDRGVGIQPAEARKIFEEFYRADDTLTSAVKGTGLGLTIASKIIHDHGGEIRYIPREGGGSTFRILLPTAEEQT